MLGWVQRRVAPGENAVGFLRVGESAESEGQHVGGVGLERRGDARVEIGVAVVEGAKETVIIRSV
jgi:hypothetical protein